MVTQNFPRSDEPPDEPARRRNQMVLKQLVERGIYDERVLEAMRRVPRHEFVPDEWTTESYADRALPIACDQTISQPYTVAFMCQAAGLKGHERVLEIGTGSGYGAAVLAELATEVHTVERIDRLSEVANAELARLGFENVHVHLGDGALGYPAAAPYDAIIVTAGAKALPAAYREQLSPGGRIVIPIGSHSSGQTMYRYTFRSGAFEVEDLGGFAFVPLVSDDDQR